MVVKIFCVAISFSLLNLSIGQIYFKEDDANENTKPQKHVSDEKKKK